MTPPQRTSLHLAICIPPDVTLHEQMVARSRCSMQQRGSTSCHYALVHLIINIYGYLHRIPPAFSAMRTTYPLHFFSGPPPVPPGPDTCVCLPLSTLFLRFKVAASLNSLTCPMRRISPSKSRFSTALRARAASSSIDKTRRCVSERWGDADGS